MEARADNDEVHDFWTGSGWVASFMRLLRGEGWQTQADFARNSMNDESRNRIDSEQSQDRREVNNFICEQEEHYRSCLTGASPQAKRIFNDIGMSRRSITRFASGEVAPAQNLPHPLEKAKEKRLALGNG